MELQGELAGLSTNSTHQTVPDSGHCIHWDQPAAVLGAIQDTVAFHGQLGTRITH